MFPLKVIAGLISQLSCELSHLAETVYVFLRSVLSLNFIAVSSCIQFFEHLCYSVTTFVAQLYHAFCYSVEDFVAFLTDVVNIFCFVLTTVHKGFFQIWSAASHAYTAIANSLSAVINVSLDCLCGILETMDALAQGTISCITLVGRALVLCGQTVVFLLCLLPRSIVGGSVFLWGAAISSIWFLENFTTACWTSTVRSILATAHWTFAVVCDLPTDLYWGISLAYFVFLLLKYLRHSQKFHRLAAQALNSVRSVRSTLQLETWNRADVPEESSSESYATDDSGEAEEHRVAVGPPVKKGKEPTVDEVFALKRRLAEERDQRLCVVCQDEEKCVILLPCRHLCLCQRCSGQVMVRDTICPVCRNYIYEAMHVFS